MRGFTAILLLLSVCETDAVMCNDGCAVVTDVVKKGDSTHHHLPKGCKECTKSSMKKCGHGQVCVSVPVKFHNFEKKNGKILENNTVNFEYSTCSGTGKHEINCGNIGNVITGKKNFANAEKFEEAEKKFQEAEKKFRDWGSRFSRHFKNMDFFDLDIPAFSDDLVIFGKREAPRKVVKEYSHSGSEISDHSMVLGECKVTSA